MIDQRLKIAVFIDFDNIEIGVKTTLHTQFDIAAILDGIKERGEVVTKVAYGDWKRAGEYGRLMSQHAIRMVQRNLTPGGDKNGADINLALDALEMAFTHDHINAFVIVGGDSDFITLVEKLKQYRQESLRRRRAAVHQSGDAEELPRVHRLRKSGETPRARARTTSRERCGSRIGGHQQGDSSRQARAEVLSDREVSPQLGLLKSTLLQLDSAFSERDYGVSTFRDFIEKLAKTGLVTLRHAGRSMMVDSVETDEGGEPAAESVHVAQPAQAIPPAQPLQFAQATQSSTPAPAAPAPVTRNQEEIQQIVDYARDVFGRAAQPPRWPMYVRQFKQFIRGVDATFDERKWGFSTIMEFMRILQREGMFRLERDRRGQIRVFPGATLQRAAVTTDAPVDVEADDSRDAVDMEPVESQDEIVQADVIEEPIRIEALAPEIIEIEESQPQPVRPRRTRKAPQAGKPAARKATGVKTPRRRKTLVPA